VKKAIVVFGPLKGLIIDNRVNRGGSGRVLEAILSYFTDRIDQTNSHADWKKGSNPI
jgi:C-terminal processing protease CtpA/Prc